MQVDDKFQQAAIEFFGELRNCVLPGHSHQHGDLLYVKNSSSKREKVTYQQTKMPPVIVIVEINPALHDGNTSETDFHHVSDTTGS
jgi:hypothetical protein